MMRSWSWVALLVGSCSAALLAAAPTTPQFVNVRYPQGSLHGFLALRSLDGTVVADGDSMQTVTADRVTSRTVFQYRDGSTSEETAVFSQRGVYRLISYRIVNTGAAFEQPLTMDVDVARGHVVVRTKGDHGEEKVDDQHMTLPPNLCNGILVTLLQDVDAARLPLTVPLLANTPGPRLVKLVITRAGTAAFLIGTTRRTAVDYVVKTDIGGVAGLVAPMVGKQPPDAHVWIMTGNVPAFVRSEAPTGAGGGPVLRTELTNPQWPK